MRFDLISTPLILGSASLIAFVSVRSTSLSDRIRDADREVIAPTTTPARRRNLVEEQIRNLKFRYECSNYALLFLLFSVVAFVAMGTLAGTAGARSSAATIAFGTGILLGAAGFGLILYEVLASKRTLFADTAFAEAVYRESMETGATPSPTEETRCA
jgi:hypothetical protein